MKTHRLTRRQSGIFEFIQTYCRDHKFPPSIREIGEGVGLTSSSTVHSHLKTLEKKGILKRNPSKPRSIEILDGSRPSFSPEARYHMRVVDHVRGLRDDLTPAAEGPAIVHEFNTPEQAEIAKIKAGAMVEAYQKMLDYLLSTSPLGGLQ